MKTTSNTTTCPTCGGVAVVTLTEDSRTSPASEGHSVDFDCANGCPVPSEVVQLRLWAKARASSYGSS